MRAGRRRTTTPAWNGSLGLQFGLRLGLGLETVRMRINCHGNFIISCGKMWTLGVLGGRKSQPTTTSTMCNLSGRDSKEIGVVEPGFFGSVHLAAYLWHGKVWLKCVVCEIDNLGEICTAYSRIGPGFGIGTRSCAFGVGQRFPRHSEYFFSSNLIYI